MVVSLKQEARSFLADVPEEFTFKINNGHVLRNMKELSDELKNISDESFVFHANSEKNDFANWVKDIIKDETLARDLRKASNRGQASRAVNSRINILSKRLS